MRTYAAHWKPESSALLPSIIIIRTGLDLVLERVLAIDQDLVEVLGLVGQAEVHGLAQLVRLVPVDDLALAVVALAHVVDEDVQHLLEEVGGGAVRRLG